MSLEMKKQRIGIFGGSFDPIHNGHLNLAIGLMESHHLDQVWFIPARINPHKVDQPPSISLEHRIAMIELAIADIPQFQMKDLESRRPSPSYTVDTLRELLHAEKSHSTLHEFFLLLGDDAIPGFSHWHRPEEIVSMVPLLVGSRAAVGRTLDCEGLNPEIMKAIKDGMTKITMMDISSTYIRDRLSQQLYCGHLVPSAVLSYIAAHGLTSCINRARSLF